jgi:hypothetical protein
LDQPAAIGVAGKDPPKRQVGSKSAYVAVENSLFTKICQTPEGYAVWDIHPVMALQVDQ